MKMLRAYVCTKPECAHMAYTLAGYVAQLGRAVLLLPSVWLEDPESAAEGYRRQAREDAEIVAAHDVKAFPVMVQGDLAENQVVTEGDWLEFSGGIS